tara:strand:- start:191 stop:379 length:189 start_codon:yes stop_codon:yes gene_type:complete
VPVLVPKSGNRNNTGRNLLFNICGLNINIGVVKKISVMNGMYHKCGVTLPLKIDETKLVFIL